MKSTKISLHSERSLITSMIVSDTVLRSVRPLYRPQYLQAVYARFVADWCCEYYDQYKKAPGKHIQDLYRTRQNERMDEDEAANLGEFLTTLSRDWEDAQSFNDEFAITQGVKYLKERSLLLLSETVQEKTSKGDLAGAESSVAAYARVEPAAGQGTSMLKDSGHIRAAFQNDEERLITFQGAIGRVIGAVSRGDFISFLAPMKRGKSWWLWWAAEELMKGGFKVAFFTLEMQKNELIRRGWRSMVGRPVDTRDITIPRFEPFEDGKETKFRIVETTEKLPGVELAKVDEIQKRFRRSFRGGDVRVIHLPAYSASAIDIEAHLDNLAYYDNYIVDAVIVDYADILAPANSRLEYRHQIDDTWKRLRRGAQERSAAYLTVSQAEKGTFSHDTDETSIAEDVRKLAHVTSMVGLNQTKAEREHGIMRLKQLAIREGVPLYDQVVALQCLDIGKACLDSRMYSKVVWDESETVSRERGNTSARSRRR